MQGFGTNRFDREFVSILEIYSTYFCRDNSTIKGNTIHRGRASCFLNTPNINRLLILLTVFRGYLVQIRSGKSTRVYVPTGASRIARGIVSEYNAAVPV